MIEQIQKHLIEIQKICQSSAPGFYQQAYQTNFTNSVMFAANPLTNLQETEVESRMYSNIQTTTWNNNNT
jgi:hypothetical protein